MYEVQMKYMDANGVYEPLTFKCENFNVNSNGYKFENIFMDNFLINDFEVCNEDIALIKIK